MDPVAEALADAVDEALPRWVERSVERLALAYLGHVPPEVEAAARHAGQRAAADVGGRVRALLAADWGEQPTTPLALLRSAVRYPAEVLRAAGVPPVVRDPGQVELFPDDDYDLTPARFADVDESLGDPGIVWGATKAKVTMERHA